MRQCTRPYLELGFNRFFRSLLDLSLSSSPAVCFLTDLKHDQKHTPDKSQEHPPKESHLCGDCTCDQRRGKLSKSLSRCLFHERSSNIIKQFLQYFAFKSIPINFSAY